jgi:methyl-accepting chemotaxis protein
MSAKSAPPKFTSRSLMRVFTNQKIGIKVAAGFCVILVFLIGMATLAVTHFFDVERNVSGLKNTSGNWQRVLQAGRELEVMRQRALWYKAVRDKAAIAQFNEAYARTIQLFTESAKLTGFEERRAMYVAASRQTELAKAKFDELVSSVDEYADAQARLYAVGDHLNAAAAQVAGVTEKWGDTSAKLAVREVGGALAAMMALNWRFQATGDPRGIPLFKAGLQKVYANIDKFEKVAEQSALIQLGNLRAAVKSYDGSFVASSAATLKSNDLYEKEIRPVLAKAYEDVQKLDALGTADTKRMTEAADTAIGDGVSYSIWLGVAAGLLGSAFAWLIGRSIARPIVALTRAMRELAGGNFEVALPGLGRTDEVGEIASAVEEFKVKAAEKARLEAEQKAGAQERAAAERKAEMRKLADGFERAVGNSIDAVSTAATELEAAARTLTTTAETTQELSTAAASASEEASSNVQSVASAAEEMSGSIHEISRQVQESSGVSSEAVQQAQKTDARINELSQAASRIGDVVKLITAIAEQTNLLALNATIEAARAGEAGKGFAVVAQEVKALAGQTAKATGDIGVQIADMQMATQDSVAAIKEIGGTIDRVSQITSAVAAAVEEQGATTQEIARSVQNAAKGTAQVAGNIANVSRRAVETGTASAQVLSSAQSLTRESNVLKLEVQKFLETVRAA